MPSGTSVSATYGCFREDDCYLNIYVYALAEDFENSEGLCGNNNDDDTDDRTVAGSNTVDNADEPIQFATSYM